MIVACLLVWSNGGLTYPEKRHQFSALDTIIAVPLSRSRSTHGYNKSSGISGAGVASSTRPGRSHSDRRTAHDIPEDRSDQTGAVQRHGDRDGRTRDLTGIYICAGTWSALGIFSFQ